MHSICAWCSKRPETVLELLELELQIVVSHQVGAGNLTKVFLESRQCFLHLNHLSSVLEEYLNYPWTHRLKSTMFWFWLSLYVNLCVYKHVTSYLIFISLLIFIGNVTRFRITMKTPFSPHLREHSRAAELVEEDSLWLWVARVHGLGPRMEYEGESWLCAFPSLLPDCRHNVTFCLSPCCHVFPSQTVSQNQVLHLYVVFAGHSVIAVTLP